MRLPLKGIAKGENLRLRPTKDATNFFARTGYTRLNKRRGWEMAVYLDLVMGLNFVVDFLLLLGTNRLSGFSPGWRGITLAALLGSLYAGACMMPSFRFLGNGLWRIVSLAAMGAIAFGLNRSAVKRTGIFVLLAMAMGGVATGMGRSDFGMLLASALVVCLLCWVGFGNRIGGREYVPLTIQEGNVILQLTALKDTGNTLRDPITGEQVLVIGPEYARKLTGLTEQQLLSPMETMLAGKIPGMRLIPYRAVGQQGSMLLAKRFRHVTIGNWKGSALVAFAPEQIGKGEVYQALTGGAV